MTFQNYYCVFHHTLKPILKIALNNHLIDLIIGIIFILQVHSKRVDFFFTKRNDSWMMILKLFVSFTPYSYRDRRGMLICWAAAHHQRAKHLHADFHTGRAGMRLYRQASGVKVKPSYCPPPLHPTRQQPDAPSPELNVTEELSFHICPLPQEFLCFWRPFRTKQLQLRRWFCFASRVLGQYKLQSCGPRA